MTQKAMLVGRKFGTVERVCAMAHAMRERSGQAVQKGVHGKVWVLGCDTQGKFVGVRCCARHAGMIWQHVILV